jgi:hypothetical protein
VVPRLTPNKIRFLAEEPSGPQGDHTEHHLEMLSTVMALQNNAKYEVSLEKVISVHTIT